MSDGWERISNVSLLGGFDENHNRIRVDVGLSLGERTYVNYYPEVSSIKNLMSLANQILYQYNNFP